MELSSSEIEVVRVLCNDKVAKEAADELHKSVHTVNAQIKSAKSKMGCGTIQGLVAKFVLLHMLCLSALIYAIYLLLKLDAPDIISKAIQIIKP